MAIISRGIGWSQESNLLWYILKQLNQLTGVLFGLKPKYKVYTALLTQSGGDGEDDVVSGGNIFKGITYYININDSNGDFTQYGAPNNNVGTYFVCNQDGFVPEGAQVYYNTGAPTVTVLENTIGDMWFTYDAVGQYIVNSNGLFTQNKTAYFITNTNTADFTLIFLTPNEIPNGVNIASTNILGVFTDSLFFNVPIEIRVYN